MPEIQWAISNYGYNIRSLIQVLDFGPATLESEIASKIDPIQPATLVNLIKHDAESATNVSHSLVVSRCVEQPAPGTDKYLGSDILSSAIASPAVWRLLLEIRGRKVYSEQINILDLFRRIPEMASSAGWLWESLCHTFISKGGNFTLSAMDETEQTLVPSNRTTPLSLARLDPLYFASNDTLQMTCDPSKYFVPIHGNNPTFDSFLHHQSVGVGFQMTLGRNHTLNSDGLRMLNRRLGVHDQANQPSREKWFVFVIREGSSFRCAKPSRMQMGRFKFFTLGLEPPDSEHLLSSLTGMSLDDLDFAAIPTKVFDEAVEMDRSGPLVLPKDEKMGDNKDEEMSGEEMSGEEMSGEEMSEDMK